ncbi:matrix metalloproteinase-11 [Zobellia amurskyensis]|uniref:Matrix metalloproteinase-11 n=1 Tax=Zobellia amurskyensis TaxID=248905 RepID=A0A7X2ZQZ4_9FLAO|nr:matrixin family metalloprotease [Zobellia amurskyensis]MUH34770.1 matrix metalloproteinase-11 [Zobellia amurskyensis]
MGKKSNSKELFAQKSKEELAKNSESAVHQYGDKFICMTDRKGQATAGSRSPLEILVDASEGFIPLWAQHQVLRWTFDESALYYYMNPERIKTYLRELLGEALLTWGEAVPVRFSENPDNSDFQIHVAASDNCNAHGCVLASAFFPDSGRHQLVIYPKMFEQTKQEQLETMMHELGHVFGLRHFFAKISEQAWPSEIFGEHKPFSIMNYGAKSVMTDEDIRDLKHLYELAWSGELVAINGTPIHLVMPFHTICMATV